jgi:hypothetical protein
MPDFKEWMRLYASPSPNTRRRAAIGILNRGDEAPLELLIDILNSSQLQSLGAKTEKVLLKRTDQQLVPAMIGLLGSENDFVREVACNVLGNSGYHVATPYLLRMVDDDRMMVRRAAGLGLAFLNDKSALPELRQSLERHRDDDPNVVAALKGAINTLEGNVGRSQTEVQRPVRAFESGDFVGLYRARVHEQLCRSIESKDFPIRLATKFAEVLLLPSFHPEICLQAIVDESHTRLRLATVISSIWYYENDSLHAATERGAPPDLVEEVAVVSKSDGEHFWRVLDSLDSNAMKDSRTICLDGMSMHCSFRSGTRMYSFDAHSPLSESPQALFVTELYRLACKNVNDSLSLERLEQIHCYLDVD